VTPDLPASGTVQSGDLSIQYRELGSGPAVLLLHGWPTSSYLWRDVMPRIAERNRVIAPDLPGFGASSKPLEASYDFPFYEEAIDGFLSELGIDRVSLAVHDLGGPIGVRWAIRRPERVERLAILNTLLYARLHWTAVAFVAAAKVPGVRALLASDRVLDLTMRTGIAKRERRTEEVLAAVREPFRTREARRVLVKAAQGLNPSEFRRIQDALPRFEFPVRVVYGERDRILPDVARTMGKVKRDIPHADVTALPDCGHFLQEDDPERVGTLLAEFFAG
jgi:haloalkane dehalogenase